MFFLASGAFLPATFADTGAVSASPSVASANTTISVISKATLTQVTPGGHSDSIFFVAVLTPSGTIYGCISGSSTCNIVGFESSTTSGTYQCTIPFGGGVSTLSVTTTGGGIALGTECTGSNAGTWTGINSNLCGGPYPAGVTCSGMTGYNDLVNGCGGTTPYGVGFGTLSPSAGDTSVAGTYYVVDCWFLYTQSPSGGSVLGAVSSTTTFQISPSSGAPEFPAGMAILLAVALPVLLLVRAKSASSQRNTTRF